MINSVDEGRAASARPWPPVAFEPDAVKSHLDALIGHWRAAAPAGPDTNQTDTDLALIASCYVDAFQSVRRNLFGETLPVKDAPHD